MRRKFVPPTKPLASKMRKGSSFQLIGFLFFGTMAINMFQMKKGLGLLARKSDQEKRATQTIGSVRNMHSVDRSIRDPPPPDTREATGKRRGCTRKQIIDGRWVPVRIKRPPYMPRNQHLRCYPEEAYSGMWSTHRWQPKDDTCEFSEWNQSEFCSLMESGTILIAGDSLSWGAFFFLGTAPWSSNPSIFPALVERKGKKSRSIWLWSTNSTGLPTR